MKKQLMLAIILLTVIAAVALGVRAISKRNSADVVSARDAARLIQNETENTKKSEQNTGKAQTHGNRPAPGTYTYVGAGREQIDRLGGSEHTFPDEVPLVVTLDAEDECRWSANLIFVLQHVETREYCTDQDGVLDLGTNRSIEFFGRKQVTVHTCADDAWRFKHEIAPGDSWSWKCHEDKESESTYTATFLGYEPVTVDDKSVDTAHIRINAEHTGNTVGGDKSELWMASTGLVIRFKSNADVTTNTVLGKTSYQERSDYTLQSIAPVPS